MGFGVGEINPCSNIVTVLIRSAFQLVLFRACDTAGYFCLWNIGVAYYRSSELKWVGW